MKFHSLRTSLVGTVFALLAAVLLGSCGGGGAASSNEGGPLQLLPLNATFFAGMPNTMVITGGRRPYMVVSSDPGVLPVPLRVDSNTFTVIPNNPGVLDSTTTTPGVRSVTVTVTDTTNGIAQAIVNVTQNFLTGYGITFTSNCATLGAQACAGGESALTLEANFNGALIGNRTYRLEVLRGPFSWVFPDGQIAGNVITVTTDHRGRAVAIIRVNNNVATQLGVFRITDVATGVSTDQVFTITGTPLATELTILPSEFTFTGPTTNRCGTGSGDFLVFDGIPPYTAVSSFGQVTVTPTSTSDQPGRFTVRASDPNTCLTDATIIVTDSNNARGTVTVTTEVGTADPPPPALRIVPSSMTLTCQQSGSVLIIGGSGTYAATTTDITRLTVTPPSGSVLTVTRNGTDPGATPTNPTPVVSLVTVTDGSTTATLGVTSPTNCTP